MNIHSSKALSLVGLALQSGVSWSFVNLLIYSFLCHFINCIIKAQPALLERLESASSKSSSFVLHIVVLMSVIYHSVFHKKRCLFV